MYIDKLKQDILNEVNAPTVDFSDTIKKEIEPKISKLVPSGMIKFKYHAKYNTLGVAFMTGAIKSFDDDLIDAKIEKKINSEYFYRIDDKTKIKYGFKGDTLKILNKIYDVLDDYPDLKSYVMFGDSDNSFYMNYQIESKKLSKSMTKDEIIDLLNKGLSVKAYKSKMLDSDIIRDGHENFVSAANLLSNSFGGFDLLDDKTKLIVADINRKGYFYHKLDN